MVHCNYGTTSKNGKKKRNFSMLFGDVYHNYWDYELNRFNLRLNDIKSEEKKNHFCRTTDKMISIGFNGQTTVHNTKPIIEINKNRNYESEFDLKFYDCLIVKNGVEYKMKKKKKFYRLNWINRGRAIIPSLFFNNFQSIWFWSILDELMVKNAVRFPTFHLFQWGN